MHSKLLLLLRRSNAGDGFVSLHGSFSSNKFELHNMLGMHSTVSEDCIVFDWCISFFYGVICGPVVCCRTQVEPETFGPA